jgi:hypothetical protein
MEDWVEFMHQTGQRLRLRFRTVKCFEIRAKAMSKTIQMHSHPGINDQIEGVTKRASNTKRSNDAASKRKDRVERRIKALMAYEAANAVNTNERVCGRESGLSLLGGKLAGKIGLTIV